MNDLIDNTDKLMLLRPLSPEREIPIPPAVDPVAEPNGAQGVVVAEIFAVKPNSVEDFAKQPETTFASCRSAGAREAGVMVTHGCEKQPSPASISHRWAVLNLAWNTKRQRNA
jgi:hypothetical protein